MTIISITQSIQISEFWISLNVVSNNREINQFNNVKNAIHIIGNNVKPKITFKNGIIFNLFGDLHIIATH